MSKERVRIEIVTGPNGAARGSEVFIDGRKVDRLLNFSVSSDSPDGIWIIELKQAATPPSSPDMEVPNE